MYTCTQHVYKPIKSMLSAVYISVYIRKFNVHNVHAQKNDKKNMKSEHSIQTKIFQTTWNLFPKFRRQIFAVPNGGKRNLIEATRLKQSGVVPGIPDLIFCTHGKTFFFELKNEKGKLSDDQKIIIATFRQNEFPVYVIRDEQQFFQIFLFIIMEQLKPHFTDQQIKQSYADLMKIYDIKLFGLTIEELEYQNNVFNFIFKMELETRVEIASICKQENIETFLKIIRKFVIHEFDVANGFFIQLSADNKYFLKSKSNLTK